MSHAIQDASCRLSHSARRRPGATCGWWGGDTDAPSSRLGSFHPPTLGLGRPPSFDRCSWWSALAILPASAMSSVILGQALAGPQVGVGDPGVAREPGGGGRSRAVGASTAYISAAHEAPTGVAAAPATSLTWTRGPGTTATAAVVGAGEVSTADGRPHELPRRAVGPPEHPGRQRFFPLHRSVNAPHCFGRRHPSLLAATPAPHDDRRRTVTTCTGPAVAAWTMMSNQTVPAKMGAHLRHPAAPSPTLGSLQAAVRVRHRSLGFLHTRGRSPPPCCGGSR